MQYSITVNQKAIIDAGIEIDFAGAAIIDYMIKIAATGELHTIKVGRKIYYWFAYDKILKDLPLLGISKSGLYKRIKQMQDEGLIEPHPENRRLAKSYFHLTKRANLTQFSPQKPTEKSKEVAKKPTEKSHKVNKTYGKKSVAPMEKSKELPTEKSKEYHSISNHSIKSEREKNPTNFGYPELLQAFNAEQCQPLDRILNQNVRPEDWPKIKAHLPGFLQRTDPEGKDGKPFRGGLMNYIKNQKWKTDKNPTQKKSLPSGSRRILKPEEIFD